MHVCSSGSSGSAPRVRNHVSWSGSRTGVAADAAGRRERPDVAHVERVDDVR